MPWHVWEDHEDEDKTVYALFTSADNGEWAETRAGYARMYKLGAAGRVEEVSTAVIAGRTGPPDLVTELGDLSKPAGLSPGSAQRAINMEGTIYAYARGALWTFDETQTWVLVDAESWPKGLTLLADCSLAVLHPSFVS